MARAVGPGVLAETHRIDERDDGDGQVPPQHCIPGELFSQPHGSGSTGLFVAVHRGGDEHLFWGARPLPDKGGRERACILKPVDRSENRDVDVGATAERIHSLQDCREVALGNVLAPRKGRPRKSQKR